MGQERGRYDLIPKQMPSLNRNLSGLQAVGNYDTQTGGEQFAQMIGGSFGATTGFPQFGGQGMSAAPRRMNTRDLEQADPYSTTRTARRSNVNISPMIGQGNLLDRKDGTLPSFGGFYN